MKTLYSPREMMDSELCIGCGSCVIHSAEAKMKFDIYGQLKPHGSAQWINQKSENFSRICPFSPASKNEDELSEWLFPNIETKKKTLGRYLATWVGHVKEGDYRRQGTSGGMTTWVATELLRKGIIDAVVHVKPTKEPHPEGKFFQYTVSRSEEEIEEGAKSRYYPVELSEVLKIILNTPGKYAIIGVPCMIKAVHLLSHENSVLRERVWLTMALFCGHMKSAHFVESFAWQMKVPVEEIKKIDFRNKQPNWPANWYNVKLTLKNGREVNRHWWHLVDGDWGAGFFMNSACNYCDDLVGETADVSFGDAWIEPYASSSEGNNVIIVRDTLINQLIKEGIKEERLFMEAVSPEFVEQTQAAGFRQRREGLAYRLAWAPQGVKPRKRVKSSPENLPGLRKRIYWMRFMISKWSHRIFFLAQTLNNPSLYLSWARTVGSIYYGTAYHNGKIGKMRKRYRELKADTKKTGK